VVLGPPAVDLLAVDVDVAPGLGNLGMLEEPRVERPLDV
jgi:hypothetical protein